LREKVSVEDRRMRGLSKAKAATGLSAVAAFLFFNPSPDLLRRPPSPARGEGFRE
jgi:hypothetical protein